MNKLILILGLILFTVSANSQRYITKNGHIKFYSETPVETIEAHNQQVNAALDTETGDFVFKVLMKSFEFEKALMQEHFNENYVESDKFPNATFKGKVVNLDEIDFSKDGEYITTIEGALSIHGVTKKIREKGKFMVKGDKVAGSAVFIVKPADYDIKIPKTVINNIAEDIEVSVDIELNAFEN